jgi:hypothetical protein
VGQQVDSGAKQALGVVQIEHVRGDPEPAFVRLLDRRAIDRLRHLRRGPEVVVDTDLDPVRLQRRDAVDFGPRFVRRAGGDDRTRHQQSCSIGPAGTLRRPKREPRIAIAAEADDRRHPVPGV